MPKGGPGDEGSSGFVEDVTVGEDGIGSGDDGVALREKNVCLGIGNQGDGYALFGQQTRRLAPFVTWATFQDNDSLNL